jgi:hypothetical protein
MCSGAHKCRGLTPLTLAKGNMYEQPINIDLVREALDALTEIGGISSFSYSNRLSDPYWQVAMKAQVRLAELGWVFGIGKWLKEADPGLYSNLYIETPGKIDRLWESHGSMDEFQAVLDEWVEAHRQALSLWIESAPSSGIGHKD